MAIIWIIWLRSSLCSRFASRFSSGVMRLF